MNAKHNMKRMSRLHLAVLAMLMCAAGSLRADNNGGEKLSGTPIGSPSVDYGTGNVSTTVNQPSDAFDGNTNTFYASYGRSNTWVGLDLGQPYVITRVGWCPRNTSMGPARVQLALFEGSNSPDFLDAVPLYLIPAAGTIGQMEHADVNVSRGFRYVRYVGPNNARCNIGELEFYGNPGAGDDSQFYQVTNLPTVSIHTYSGADPVDKVNNLEANITITYNNGTLIQEYPITARCRGNASLGFPKKPYRIKFNDGKSHHMLKGSPLESPAKAKKWTLINNYGDKTLMRNILAFEVSRRLGMPYTVYCQPVDVIMNGEYKGCYQLCDQISVDPNRVRITEMEPYETEEPEVTGGYLLEVDAYAYQESSWFNSSHGNPVTIKSPGEDEIVSQQSTYIRNYFNEMENALFGTDYRDPAKGYRKYIDVESFMKHFIVGEFSGNTDTYWSTYMYKERGEAIFTIGPSWDFDLAFNNDNRIYPVSNRSDWVYRSGGSGAGNMRNFVNRILSDSYASNRLETIWKDARDAGIMSNESLLAYVDSIADDIRASATLNFIRWPILNSKVHQNAFALGSFQAEVNVVRDYIPERIAWFDNKLKYKSSDVYPDSIFYIGTPDQLIEFARYVRLGGNGSEAYLTADIDMDGKSTSFVPIGSGQYPFCGTFDGQGHRISNLHINGANDTGFFGTVTGGATMRNFIIDSSCSISGTSYVGVIGTSNGSGDVIMQCIGNEASISASGVNAGGIIGCNYSSAANFIIENCYNTGTIVGGSESGAISGWVGSGATITNCFNIGTVSGYDNTESYLYRGAASLNNTYSTLGTQGIITTTDAVESGELCYRLNNGNTDEPIWRQTLRMDLYPTFLPHAVVDFNGTQYFNVGINYGIGDADGDGDVDALDLKVLANYLIGKTNEVFVYDNADANADQSVDVYDIVAIADIIQNSNPVRRHAATRRREQGQGGAVSLVMDDFSMQANAQHRLTVEANLPDGATAFYAELSASENLSIGASSVSLESLKGSSHIIDANHVDGVLRVVGYSPANEAFTASGGALFSAEISSEVAFAGGSIHLAAGKIGTASLEKFAVQNAECQVGLSPTPVSAIDIAQDLYILEVGEQVTLEATVLPETASMKDIAWSCSDNHVGYVSRGVFTARNSGGAILTATAKDGSGVTATARVRVLGSDIEIASVDDLQEFSEVVNAGYTTVTGRMTADIDMAGMAFVPIGTEKNLFAGTFDGQGHIISNLRIEKPNDTAVGLFGNITSPATIKNLVLDATCSITGLEKAGLVGRADRSGIFYLENLGNEGAVTADIAPAGIIGNANNSSVAYITNCYSSGPITTITYGKTNADAAQISGWLGNVGAVLTNCWSTSDITGFQTSGYASTTDRTFARTGGSRNTFTNCYSQVSKQVNLTDISKFRSGEVTYLLNEGETENPVWFQTLPDDLHPTFLAGHGVVYKVGENEYSNMLVGIEKPNADAVPSLDTYDLSGRMLRGTKPLQPGIYIVNGKKVMIK